jgi:hypothetical protein
MNINKINPGMVLSYKELCTILEEPTKTGNSKPSQLKEWSRYFLYFIQGKKFHIEKLYDVPMPKSLRDGHEDMVRYSLTLLDNLAGRIDETKEVTDVFMTKAEVYKVCGFVGQEYYEFRERLYDECRQSQVNRKYTDITIKELNFWYKLTSNEFKELVANLRKSLVSRKILIWEDAKMFYDVKERKTRFATFEESVIIKDIENDSLQALDCKTLFEVYAKNKQNDFYSYRNNLITEQLNVTKIQDGYRIGFTKALLTQKEHYRLTEGVVAKDKLETNGYVKGKVKQKGKEVYTKGIKNRKIDEFEGPDFLTKLLQPNFLHNFNTLTDELMSLDI